MTSMQVAPNNALPRLFADDEPENDDASSSSTSTSLPLEKQTMEVISTGGRRSEFADLHRAYIRSETSNRFGAKPQVVVVTGPSGIGKSYFVNHSLDIICRHDTGGGWDNYYYNFDEVKNFVISGKCNEMNQNQPYACIIDALSVLCDQLCQLDSLLASIQQEILCALNNEGGVLVDFVPAMMNVIGDDHEIVSELKGKERQVRLERVIRRFLGVIATYCPVVIQLDDLQWADGATLNLIQNLASSSKLPGLLLICIYRENDVDSKRNNMLDKYFLQIKEDGACMTNIKIKPLSSMVSLIHSSGLELDKDDSKQMAKFLARHTGGNTFFAVRLLNYVIFRHKNVDRRRLVSALNEIFIPPTLDDLLTIEINCLPPLARDFLVRASCIGYYFDDVILKEAIMVSCIDDEVTKVPPFQRQRAMTEAIQLAKGMGLVEEVEQQGYYRFIHDYLWKSFYSTMPQASQNVIHLEIGRAMKRRLRLGHQSINIKSKSPRARFVVDGVSLNGVNKDNLGVVDRYLCSTVDQLNKGKALMSQQETIELLMMNIKAAELSTSHCSWKSALVYIEQIAPMLSSAQAWEWRYDLCLLVNTMQAEINFNLGHYEMCESSVKMILRHGKSIDDTFDAYLLLMRSVKTQQKTEEALAIAQDVLAMLGAEAVWLKRGESSEKDSFRQIIRTMAQKKQTLKKLAALSPIYNHRTLKAIQIFYWLLIACYGTDLHELVSGQIFQLTLQFGYCEEGINGILTYTSGYVHQGKKKAELCLSASELRNQLNSEKLQHDYCLILGGYLQCWSSNLRDSLSTLLDGLQIGNKNGHVNNAAMCGSLLCSYSLFSGERLYVVEDRMNHFADWAKEERLFGSSRLGFLPFLQLVKCLQEGGSGSKESLLEGEEMNTAEMNAAAEISPMVSCTLAVIRLELACIFGDFALAKNILLTAPNVLEKRPGHFSGCRFTFFEFIASVEIAQREGTSTSCPWSKRADAAQKQIENWIRDGNVNCSHLMPLVQAEISVLKGKKNQARKHFQQVVLQAKSGPYLQDRAISLERAAVFFLTDGDTVAATTYYMRSRDLFKEWGAYAKIRSMNKNQKWSDLIRCRFTADKSSASVKL